MIDDSETPPKSNSETDTAQSGNRDTQWRDTIDDWETVLTDGDSETQDSAPDPTDTEETSSEAVQPTWSMDGERDVGEQSGWTANASSETDSAADSPTETEVATNASTEADSAADSPTETEVATNASTEADSATASPTETEAATNASSEADSDTYSPPLTEACSEFVRIEPISSSLLKATVQVLPEVWLEDTEIQQLVQWVVYAYIEDTDPSSSTASRIETAIDRAADEMNMNADTIQMLCTTSLYRGRPGVPVDNFSADLKKIQQHLTSVYSDD